MKTRLTFLLVFLSFACQKKATEPISVEFRIAEMSPAEGLTQMIFSGWGHQDTFYVYPNIELTEKDVVSARVTSMNDHPAVAVEFNDTGATILSRLTGDNIGKHMAMIVDGMLIAAPRIQAQISQGRAILNGEYTEEQARDVANRLDP